jgi:tetratricopeptide (TPR) repeat protein
MQTKILFRIVTLILAVTLIAGCTREARKNRLLGEADRYFQAGDYDKAKLAYMNVLKLDRQNALAFERLGAMWQDDASPLHAGAFLIKASELDPKNIQNRVRLARCYVAMGRLADATKEALKVLEQAPDNGDALVVLAEAARSKEEIQAVKEQLEKFPKNKDVSFYLASANLALKSGDPGAAGNALRDAVAADPKSAAAHMAMGDLYLLQKDQKRGGEEFKKAANLAPVRAMERLKYAALMSSTGNIEEVRRIATEMTKQARDYPAGWSLLAEVAMKEKKYDEALSLLENVFGRDPDYIDGRRVQSNVLLAKGDTKKAVEVLERLDQSYPNVPLLKYDLGRAYVVSGNLNQAKLALEGAVSINPTYTDAVVLLAQVNLRSGQADKAIEQLTDLLKRRPELKNATLLLAAAYGAVDRPDDAAAVLENQARISPNDPELAIATGLTYRQAKRNDEARRAFEKAAQLAPNHLWPIDQLIELDLQDKHFDAARQRIRTHFQQNPNVAAAHYFEGKILAAEQKWDAAEPELQRALELDPSFAAVYDLLVQSYLARNKLPQAASELQGLLSNKPKSAPALTLLALVYEQMNDYPKACDVYEKLLAIKPDSVVALNNLAYLNAEHLNNLDKAYELARKARQLTPDDPSIADTFGWVLYKRGDYQQALPILQESAQKAADKPEIQFHLGMTAYVMGQTDLAKTAFKKALSAKQDFPHKNDSQSRLALLEGGAGLSIAQLESMAKEQPKDVIVQMRLGEAYEKQGAPDKAVAAFEQALNVNPKLSTVVTKLAQLNAGPLHNKEQAIGYAKKARELAPGDPQITALVGRVAYESGDFSWSYSLLQEAARQRTNDPAVLHDLAWAAYSLGKINEARDAMQRVLTNNPDSTQAGDAKEFLALAALDENPKQVMAADSQVKKVLKSRPDYVPALMAQAAIDAQRGQAKQASEIYEEILRRMPDFAPAQKRLASLDAQDPSTIAVAYDLATKARKALPDDPELAELLGRLSYEKKEYPRAIQLLQETARKRPLDADSLFYLGMSQLQARQKTEGRGALDQALAGGLQEPLASEAKRALAGLQKE